MEDQKIKEDVWQFIQNLNRLWTVGKSAQGLEDYFHENMVAITPSAKERIVGKEACVASWQNFAQSAKIHFWKELDPEVQLFNKGNSAVVTYYFDMSFDFSGQGVDMCGRDMFVVTRTGKMVGRG